MRGVIKQGGFVSITGTAPPSVMQSPTRSIDNGEKPSSQSFKQDDFGEQLEDAEQALTEREREREAEQQKRFEAKNAEIAHLKFQCEKECEELRLKAETDAKKVADAANETARILRINTDKECVEIRKRAEESGYADGFAKGEKPGYDAGFKKGLDECKNTLNELNAMLGRFPKEKEQIFKEYENKLFDLIFTICNKITVGSLTQKDKAVVSKMLKEAAKNFRGSSFIKVSLSKLDIEESVNVDLDDLARIFKENQHIEFEILKDAPKGTLILDNGSEITDAGIQTQLKMIENLGKGKFKNKPKFDEDQEEKIEERESG